MFSQGLDRINHPEHTWGCTARDQDICCLAEAQSPPLGRVGFPVPSPCFPEQGVLSRHPSFLPFCRHRTADAFISKADVSWGALSQSILTTDVNTAENISSPPSNRRGTRHPRCARCPLWYTSPVPETPATELYPRAG